MQIQTARLLLRQTTINDLDFVYHTEHDKENRSYIGQWTIEQHQEALKDEDILHLLIENKQGEKTGYVILSGLLDTNKALCIRRIAIKLKGHGYGKEVMKGLIEWGFENNPAHRIWLDVKDFNQRAIHVYESVGFVYEGTLRDSYFNGEGFESLVIMSILREEYTK
ncbi:GNAT family N-acetyltransferase [Paenibacillus radicis (ex Gao et al. 2016)]|uniref:N-acetyltransferase n=1 Tax=Paenibacillus radicis (ex Gao et al. 2016) TaxID=1737354 RepID=A0A917M222_9BACL|nr:GNAT family protein [Paenibacillus radicis (ex Gao et al. 2016)]GGG70007.1 N-acetyltransferase [Paenibacillus radicis (ex Gao et al. 2016)]